MENKMIGYKLQIVDKDGDVVAERLFRGHELPRIGETFEIMSVGSLDDKLKIDVENSLRQKGWLNGEYTILEFLERIQRGLDFHNKFAGRYEVLDVQHITDLHFYGGTGDYGFANVAREKQNLTQILVNTYGSCGNGEHQEASTQTYLPRVKVRKKIETLKTIISFDHKDQR